MIGLIITSDFGYRKVLGKSLIDLFVDNNKGIKRWYVLVKKEDLMVYKDSVSSSVNYIFCGEFEEFFRYVSIDDRIVVFYDDFYVENVDFDACKIGMVCDERLV